MASALTNDGADVALDALGAVIAYLSVHDVDVPTDDTSEPSGGSPAYARKAASWAAASGGSMTLTSTLPVWNVPAGFTVKSVGLWSADSGGTLYGSFDVADEAFAGQGTYTLTAGSISL